MLVLLTSTLSIVSAEISPGSYRLNEDAYLIQTCDNCTYVNITTIVLGNKSVLELNVSMTSAQGFYYYILDNAYVDYPGDYLVSGIANPDGIFTRWSYSFTVSQLAITQTTSQAIGSAIFLFLMIILMFVLGYMGMRLTQSDTWWVLGIFMFFLSALLLVYNTWLGYQYHKLFTGLPDSAVPERIFWILLMIIVLGLLVSAGLLFMRWKEVLRYVKKEIKRKPERDEDLEDWDVDSWGGEKWDINTRKRPV